MEVHCTNTVIVRYCIALLIIGAVIAILISADYIYETFFPPSAPSSSALSSSSSSSSSSLESAAIWRNIIESETAQMQSHELGESPSMTVVDVNRNKAPTGQQSVIDLASILQASGSSKNSLPIDVGILVMAVGRFAPMAGDFVKAARHHLLTRTAPNGASFRKTFFIFTDRRPQTASAATWPHGDDVVIVHQKNLGWPLNSLLRCSSYLRQARTTAQMKQMDYLISIDADMRFVSEVGTEILGDLVGVKHPGFYDKDRSSVPYEQSRHSCAAMPSDLGEFYFSGRLFGGRTKSFLSLCKATTYCIRNDISPALTSSSSSSSYVAIWLDESYLNRFFAEHKPTTVLSPAYCYPEDSRGLPFDKKIVALRRDVDEMRGVDRLFNLEARLRINIYRK